jgi:pilus assembly protein CpaF
MEGDVITLQDVFRHVFVEGGRESAKSAGRLRATGLRPKLVDKLREAGVDIPPKLFRDGKGSTWADAQLQVVGNGRGPQRRRS